MPSTVELTPLFCVSDTGQALVVAVAFSVSVVIVVAIDMTVEFIVAASEFDALTRLPGLHAVKFVGLSVKFAIKQSDATELQVNVRLWKSPQAVSACKSFRLPVTKGQRDLASKEYIDCLLDLKRGSSLATQWAEQNSGGNKLSVHAPR